MRHSPESLAHPLDVARLLIKYPLRWLLPAVVIAAAVGAFAAVRTDSWEATQQLMVRNEAAANNDGPGKFRHSDELKGLLETILEVTRGRPLLADALAQVDTRRPTDEAVTDLAEAVKLVPPKGAEYGKTEVFYLKVRDADRQRALSLCDAICTQLDARLAKLRNGRAQSMLVELQKSEEAARDDLNRATKRLGDFEALAGGDLSELRNLYQSSGGGESDLRRRTLELESELRQATLEEQRLGAWHAQLIAAQGDPEQQLTLPGDASQAFSQLRRLNEQLLDARLRRAALQGIKTDVHPDVQSAIFSERQIVSHFGRELSAAIRAVSTDWQLAQNRVERLSQQIPRMRERLERLAELRAEYGQLVSDVEQRTRTWNGAQTKLVDGRAMLSSAESVSLMTRIDQSDTGSKPVGPGRSTIALLGVVGGLVCGVGWLVLSVQTTSVEPVACVERPADLPLRSAPAADAPSAEERGSWKKMFDRVASLSQRVRWSTATPPASST